MYGRKGTPHGQLVLLLLYIMAALEIDTIFIVTIKIREIHLGELLVTKTVGNFLPLVLGEKGLHLGKQLRHLRWP